MCTEKICEKAKPIWNGPEMNLSSRSEKAQPTSQVAVKAGQPSRCSKSPWGQGQGRSGGRDCVQSPLPPRLSHSAVPLSQLRLAELAQSINHSPNPELHLKGWHLMAQKAASPLTAPFNLTAWTSRKQRRWEMGTPKFSVAQESPHWAAPRVPVGLQPPAQGRACFHSSQLGNPPKPSLCLLSLQKCPSHQPRLAPLALQASTTPRLKAFCFSDCTKGTTAAQHHLCPAPWGALPTPALFELCFLQLSLKLAQQNISIWAWQHRGLQVSSVSSFT